MIPLSCVSVRRRLGAHHDGELEMEAQVAVEAHLSSCAACSQKLRELSVIGELVRRGAVRPECVADAWQAQTDADAAGDAEAMLPATLASVVHQAVAERREDWPESVDRVMLGTTRVWIPGGALAVSVAGAALVATILSLFTPTNARSLAAVLDPGSNQNPVMVARGVSVPQVSLDTGLAVLFNEPLTLPTPNLALAAVVTREGEVSSLEVLSPHAFPREILGGLSRLTTDIRFKPAEYGGSPVAVKVVWLFEHTTVRPSPGPSERRPAPALVS